MKKLNLIFILLIALVSHGKPIDGVVAENILEGLGIENGRAQFAGRVECTVYLDPSVKGKSGVTECLKVPEHEGKADYAQDPEKLYHSLDVAINLEEDSHSKQAFVDCEGSVKITIFGKQKVESAKCLVDDLY